MTRRLAGLASLAALAALGSEAVVSQGRREPAPEIKAPKVLGGGRKGLSLRPRRQPMSVAKAAEHFRKTSEHYGRLALTGKLPKDLHPHVRRREEMRRAFGSPAAGTQRIG